MALLNNGTYNNYIGHHLESELLKKLLLYSDVIYTEKELVKKYGYHASSIDFVLLHENKYIFIQTKWRKTRRRENHCINNFIDSITYLCGIIGYDKYSFGIWSSRLEPFDDNKVLLLANKVYSVNNFETIQGLVNKTETFIKNKLIE
jgi:hypothetical protein